MSSAGVELIEHIRDLSIVGITEIVKHLPKIRRQYLNCVRQINENRPDALILVDYPGFNLKLAKYAHSLGIPVIYYIIPQVWAWGTGRVKTLKKFTNKLFVLFDFEKKFLEK